MSSTQPVVEDPEIPTEAENRPSWYERAIRYQTEFERYHRQWREFSTTSEFDCGLIKTMIGLALYGSGSTEVPDDNSLPLNNYYQLYSSDRQEYINLIFNQLMNLPFNVSSPNVHLGLTCLFGTCENDDDDALYIVFRTRDSRVRENVHFIDHIGRVYDGWENFVENNRLPSCRYVTVSGGVYTNDNVFQTYESPAANAGILQPLVEWGTTIGAVGCVTTSIFAIAPVTTAVAGFAIGVTGITQSVRHLLDRSQHRQSIGFDNRESIVDYLNIGASVLGGASSVATANFKRLGSLLGPKAIWASRAINAGNILTLAIDSGLLILNVQDMNERFWNGDLTRRDLFNLALNLFFLYGAVVNVHETSQALASSSNTSAQASSIGGQKLTKTQKRNLQRKRAKLRARQQVGADTVVVSTEFNFHTNFQGMARHVFPSLLNMCSPRLHTIYDTFLRILSESIDLANGRIDIKTYVENLSQHMINLYSIVKGDVQRMLNYVGEYFGSVPQNEDVAQLLINEINQINQNINEIVEDIDDESENIRLMVFEEETISPSYCKIITEAVKDIVSQKNVQYSFDVINAFHQSLKFVIDELMKQFVLKYDDIVALNGKVEQIGVEKAKKMASILGTKTECDFFPDNVKFHHCINKIIRAENTVHSYILNVEVVILKELTNKLFSKVNPVNEIIGLEKTINILSIISDVVVEQISSYLDDIKNQAKLIYETNIEILDEETVREMLQNIDLTINDAEQFRNATTKFEENESSFVDILRERCITYLKSSNAELNTELTDFSVTATNTPTDIADDTYNMYIFITCCSRFFSIISNIDVAENKLELFKKVVHFMGIKFLEELSFNQDEWRIKNVELVGRRGFEEMMKNLGLIPSEKSPLLNDIYQKLMNNSDLTIGYYLTYYENNSPNLKDFRLWDDTIHDLGFKTIRAECNKNELNDYYVVRASQLFGIQISDETLTVERYENFIVLKTETYMVTFTFYNDDSEALIICRNVLINIEDYNIEE